MVTNPPLQFLVIADSDDERALYCRTLTRKFPESMMLECRTADAPAMLGRCQEFSGVVIHFNGSPEVVAIVKTLHRLAPALPIVALSGVDRHLEASAAGATRFLPADQWLLLGSVVQELAGRPIP